MEITMEYVLLMLAKEYAVRSQLEDLLKELQAKLEIQASEIAILEEYRDASESEL
jgi:hypothetical protein